MAPLSRTFCMVLTTLIALPSLIHAAEPYWNIKSKTASGNGCPSATWVYVDQGARREFLEIGYADFKPEVSPSQPLQHSTSACQLALELDQLPAGYRFAVTGITHFAQVYIEQWSYWRQWFATRIGFSEDGPFSRMDINPSLGVSGAVNEGVTVKSGDGTLLAPAWSPCFEANATTRLYIYDRVALGRASGAPGTVPVARFEPGDPMYAYGTSLQVTWRSC